MAASKQLPFFTKAASFAPTTTPSSSNRISVAIFGHMDIVLLCSASPNQMPPLPNLRGSMLMRQWEKLYKGLIMMERVEDFERERRKRIYRGSGRKERNKVGMDKTKKLGKNLKSSGANAKAKALKRRRSDSNGCGPRKFPRKEAASSISQCKDLSTDKFTTVKIEGFRLQNEEAAAIQLTKLSKDDFLPNRRLTAFIFHDEFGEPQPFEMVEEHNLYISALILPLEDICDPEKETRIRCERFGPIVSWSLSGYDDNSPIIWVSTEAADYECFEPAIVYQKHYSLFFQKACACIEAYRLLSKSCGGNQNLSLDQLVTAIACSFAERIDVPHGSSKKDLIISWGRFIHDQLIGLDETAPKNDTIFRNLPVLVALRDASDQAADIASTRTKLKRRKNTVFSSIKNEYDIADDYPPPAYYQKGINEIDECDVFNCETDDTDQLPHYVLHDWCLYSFDGKFISLELISLKSSAVIGQEIYCSGIATVGDGSRNSLDTSSNPPSSQTVVNADRIPLHLSMIKDWKIEVKSSTVSISIRTEIAWYRLAKALPQYGPWYKPVLKTVTLAFSIAELLKDQRRTSRLSFREVVKRVLEFNHGHPAYISSSEAAVERYILIHGDTILKQFANYPDSSIRNCTFVKGLKDNLKELQRTKFARKKILPSQKEYLNQEAAVSHRTSETKAMPATTTRLISRIWRKYCSEYLPESFEYVDTEELLKNKSMFDENFKKFYCVPKQRKSQCGSTKIRWNGEAVGKTSSGEAFYKRANFRGLVVSVGDSVQVRTTDSEEAPPIFLIEYMFEDSGARKLAHGRLMLRGYQTVLGDISDKRELFLTNHCHEFVLSDIIGTITMEIQSVPWGYQHRKTYANNDKIDKERVEDKKIKRKRMEFFCRSLYCPERGAFLCLKTSSLGLGTGHCDSCKIKEERNSSLFQLSRFSFTFKGTKYQTHDFVYLGPDSISKEADSAIPKTAKSAVLKPFIICQFLGIDQCKPFKKADPESTIVKLRRFFRPEDISADKAYHSDIREIYYSEQVINVPTASIKGKCEVREKEDLIHIPSTYVFQHVFFCEQLYDPLSGALQKLPLQVRRSLPRRKSGKMAQKRNTPQKRKSGRFCGEFAGCKKLLATLDIFAGCGGLSSGLEQSGVSKTKWAIEYDKSASEAFKLNHPDATMFTRNCNVILRAIMTACGDADDCISTSEAADLAKKLEQEEINGLPRPGDVDFIIGGPPCQGFSKMNRYKERSWSKVQCEMMLAFLSYADYFRPKFFLLENVRNFIFCNKGQIFRFALASLLEMGYQVRFGILEAGAFGVSQNRKRAFIWAASPEEKLPEWPEPMYVFRGSELKIPLGGNIQYAAVGSTVGGAPFRAIAVQDTIRDLPAVKNGASEPTMKYKKGPVSWFQTQIRGEMQDLNDHISKKMSELNLLRCRKIPKRPGADWHDLPDEQVTLANGHVVDLLPQWLPNTAARNNQWEGLYGRLDWAGKFPTCVTDPQPMGKVGRWLHPSQDRILSIREYARAQGFPDSYQFAGNIHDKHRQVGNAVPPPLAFALGRKLKESIEDHHTSSESTKSKS